jgi:hypothetical protein
MHAMRFRKLRIAWTAAWAVAAVLLCVLWVRSEYRADYFRWRVSSTSGVTVFSAKGRIKCLAGEMNNRFQTEWFSIGHNRVYQLDVFAEGLGFDAVAEDRTARAGLVRYGFKIPLWLPIMLCATISAMPWARHYKWRFSLRTLLLAMTGIAALLGIGIYLMEN